MVRGLLLLSLLLCCGCACERQHKIIMGTEVKEFNYVAPDKSITSFRVQYECSWKN